jgi:hypothetical protein
MQLTAMYTTPRRNHLFAGIDFHLLDIEIENLLNMIPHLDTIMPMLKSFSGRGDFHLVFELYLDSLYNPKYSTILGAASVIGTDLEIAESDMLRRIARTLRFRNRDEIRVDTLNAEFQVRRGEIRVFPFLLSVDRYKVVVGGWHNLDMQFVYNVSIVDSPLPFRLSAEIDTSRRWMIRPARARWPRFYRPAAPNAVEDRQMQIRRQIREALTSRVITQENEKID